MHLERLPSGVEDDAAMISNPHPNPDRGTMLTLYLCPEVYEFAIKAAHGRVMWWGAQDDNPTAVLSCPNGGERDLELFLSGPQPYFHCRGCDRNYHVTRARQVCPLCHEGVYSAPTAPQSVAEVVECQECDWTGERHPATRKP